MRTHLIYIVFLLYTLAASAQPDCIFTHYSSDDGLSQNSVMSMVQDRNGALWLSTWDGINRFDGYDFKIYKASPGNRITLTNNRIDQLEVDAYDYIWLRTYDNRVYRFDQQTETFEQVPQEDATNGRRFKSIRMLPGGVVWLLMESEGAIRITIHPEHHELMTREFSSRACDTSITQVRDVFADGKGNEWLLTDDGLIRVAEGDPEPVPYFVNARSGRDEPVQAFYSYAVSGNEVYFGSDRGRVWCYAQTEGLFHLLTLPVQGRVVAVSEIQEGKALLFTTDREGVVVYDRQSGDTRVYDRHTCPGYPDDELHSAYVDSYGLVWLEQTEWGRVCHFDPSTGVFRQEKMRVAPRGADRSYPSFRICEDVNGNLWVHPQGGGLSWYDRQHDCLLPFYNDPDSPDWRFSNKLHSMYADRQGNLWLCTHSRELEKVTFRKSQFGMFPCLKTNNDLDANTVRTLFRDDERRVWMGKRDGKIEIYSDAREYLGYLTEQGTISSTGKPLEGVAYHIMQDSQGNIWIATKGGGIVLAEKKGDRFRLTRFEYDEDDIYSLSHNSVYWLHEDRNGRIWVATFGGGLNYIRKDEQGKYVFINSRNHLKGYPYEHCYRVRHITSDTQGNIWVGSSDGAVCFKDDFEDPASIEFHLYTRIPDDLNSLSHNNVYRIVSTSSGEVYLATFGGGLNRLVSMNEAGEAVFRSYTCRDGLPTDILQSVEEDSEGNLWISTENGLSKFIPQTQTFENYNEHDFSDKVRFEEGSSLNLKDKDMLLFGTCSGVLCFHPLQIRKSSYVPSIVFEGLRISNQEVMPGADGSLLKQSLNSTEHLVLSHKENIVSLYYAALDLIYPENIRYAYLLEGFDKEWNYVDHQRMATYTNLPKGDYVFRVKSTNGDGVWVDNERSLKITIRPSFWETPLALLLYVLAFVCILVVGVYILFTIYRLKHEVSIEQQVTDIKLRFFTNISHELRTPLTLIAGPVEYVMQHKQLPDDVREQLRVVERNTDRMLRLVNQILDFRKIQKNKMKLRVEQTDIVPFVRHIMYNFESLAEEHRIDFVFESEVPSLKLWIDTDKLEKIIFNLLSNAFKYTPQGKMITLFIHDNGNSVVVGVQDQGIGIPDNKKASLFVRFEDLLNKNLFNQQSSGIGLSLVKELVDLHRATIRVDSKEGEGSCFTVELQKGKDVYDESVEFILSDSVEIAPKEFEGQTVATVGKPGESKTMLLIEDNLELRFFLRSIFQSEFNVIEANDGEEGLEKALKFVPDIIISDIMMPRKDGISLTRDLRAGMATSHIPVVLLTAKSDMESKLQGMEQGADDYITKPFSATYLKARVENLLAQRLKLQQLYCANLLDVETAPKKSEEDLPPAPEMSANDRKFMDRLTELMEKNMDNGDLIVDDLVRELAVSRSVFFKKLKTLTGLAPVEFIKEMRVTRAAQLIEQGEYNMTQISYMVGINDPRYFSKCFKHRFGMTPTEYKEKARQRN